MENLIMLNMLDIMTRNVITVHSTDSVATVCSIMNKANTRHLVVVGNDGSIAGIVSDRDCKLATVSPFSTTSGDGILDQVPVSKIMVPAPHWVDPLTSVAEAAHIMLEHRISALPVIQDGNLIGIVTTTDLLGTLVAQVQ
jgi:acetoin utilization protein AcuB